LVPWAAAKTEEVNKLTIEKCLRIGLADNPQIQIAEARIEAARGQEMTVRAYFVPHVTASGSLVTSNMLPNFEIGEPIMMPTSFPVANAQGDPVAPDHIHYIGYPGFEITSDREGEIYMGKVEATWPVYNSEIWIGHYGTKLQRQMQELELEKQKLTVAYQIKQAFYGVILAREMVEVMNQAMATMEAHLDQVNALYNEGMISNLDVLQVETAVASIRPQQIEVNNGLELAKLGLANIINLDLDDPIEVEGELVYEKAELLDIAEYYEIGLDERPEMEGLEMSRELTSKIKNLTYTAYAPTVALFANYQWNRGQQMPPNEDELVEGYQAGVGVQMPIFDGLANYGKLKTIRSQLDQVEIGMRAMEKGVETEIRAAFLQLNAAEQKVAAGKINVDSAQKSFDAAEDRYAVGMANNLDVMDADVSLVQAKALHLQAIYDYKLAKANLDKAIGKISETTEEQGEDNETE
jgi:outer membrane protein TolC